MLVALPLVDWLAIACAYGGLVGLCVLWLWAASERRRPAPRRWVTPSPADVPHTCPPRRLGAPGRRRVHHPGREGSWSSERAEGGGS